MRVAGVLTNVVPYHHARWEAFSGRAGRECHVVELRDQDAFKVLEFSAAASYRRHTLFPRDGGGTLSTHTLLQGMADKLRTLQPEVVCVSGWALPVSLAALSWAASNGVCVVVLSESNEFDEVRSWLKEFIKRRIIGLCSAGLAGGNPQADYLVKLGLPRDAVALGYDVVDNDYFAAKVTAIRNTPLDSSAAAAPHFLACCRFGHKKNLPRLIEAYARYRELAQHTANPNPTANLWPLVIVGDGEMRSDTQATIERCCVSDSVRLVGAKSYSETPSYYARAGAFIHASTTEQWGLVVNEAMASGLPVLISNRCGCARDLVQPGVNGFTFDPYDVEQLGQLMLKISNPDFPLAAFGDASRTIISEWGPERFASGLQSAVDKALEVGPKRASLLQRILLRALLWRYGDR